MITLGRLIDELTIVQLKNYYADTEKKKESTSEQIQELRNEVDSYMSKVISGKIDKVEFPMNKVYKKHTIEVGSPSDDMTFGDLVSKLAEVNHKMWLNQELVYNFANVPDNDRVDVINRCATLNVERNEYIDAIDRWFASYLKASPASSS